MITLKSSRKYLYALLAASLPFPLLFSNVAIALIIIHWLFTDGKHLRLKSLFSNPLIYFIAFYFWSVISLTYSENVAVGLFDLEKKLAMIIIPLVVFTSRKLKSEEVDLILKAFIFSSGVALFICLANAMITYLGSKDIEAFFYGKLSEILNIHPLYLSLYFSFSAFSVLFLLKENRSFTKKYYGIPSVSFFFLGIILLSSRIIILVSFFILVIHLIHTLRVKNVKLVWLLILGVGLGFIMIISFNVEQVKSRFEQIKKADILFIMSTDEFPKYYTFSGEKRRVLNAKIFLELVSTPEVFFFGLGNGTGTEHLNERVNYYRRNFFNYNPNTTQYNFHNQYMEIMTDFGLIGLILLILIYFHDLRKMLLNSNMLYLYFVLLVVFASMTESILERNKGIVFFAFFSSILMFLPGIESKK